MILKIKKNKAEFIDYACPKAGSVLAVLDAGEVIWHTWQGDHKGAVVSAAGAVLAIGAIAVSIVTTKKETDS